MSSPAEEAYAMYERAIAARTYAEGWARHSQYLVELAIKAAHKNGESYADIAKRTGLSRSRVSQLVKS